MRGGSGTHYERRQAARRLGLRRQLQEGGGGAQRPIACRSEGHGSEVQRGRTKEKPKKTAPASPREKKVSDVSRRAST